MTKTKIALAAVLFAATSSAALAQGFDPNMANRYPNMASPNTYGYVGGSLGKMAQAPAHASSHRAPLNTAPVRLQQRDVASPQSDVAFPTTSEGYFDGASEFNIDRADHASSPYAGGGF